MFNKNTLTEIIKATATAPPIKNLLSTVPIPPLLLPLPVKNA